MTTCSLFLSAGPGGGAGAAETFQGARGPAEQGAEDLGGPARVHGRGLCEGQDAIAARRPAAEEAGQGAESAARAGGRPV